MKNFEFIFVTAGAFVVTSLNNGFRKGELSSTENEGIILCIPKRDKSKDQKQNNNNNNNNNRVRERFDCFID